MTININSWQQIKYSAYRYYLVEDHFLNGYVYAAVLGAAGLCMSISSHMDLFYTLVCAIILISALFKPFLFNHWGRFNGETLTVNKNNNLLSIQKSDFTYSADLNHHTFKKVAGHYVLMAGDHVFFFSQSQFDELRKS